MQITQLEIEPADSQQVVAALRAAQESAQVEQADLPAVPWYDEDAAGKRTAVGEESAVYDLRISILRGAECEVTDLRQPWSFYERDAFPAETVYAGIVFGVTRLMAQQAVDTSALNNLLSQTEYIRLT